MKREIKNANYIMVILLVLIAITLIIIGITKLEPIEKKEPTIDTYIDSKVLKLELTDEFMNGINIDYTTEESKNKGVMAITGGFSVVNSTNTEQKYKIYLEDVTDANVDKLRYTDLRYQIIKYDKSSMVKFLYESKDENKNAIVIDEDGVIKPKKTNRYFLRMWVINSSKEYAMDKAFKAKIKISQ